MTTISRIRMELADREAIRECLSRYCRGIDRLDTDLLRGVFGPDATVENSMYHGAADEWIETLAAASQGVDTSHHLIGNMIICIDGDAAGVETYWTARQRMSGATAEPRDLVLAGRYLDRMIRYRDEWRVSTHRILREWSCDQPADVPVAGAGLRSSLDASYDMLTATGRA